MLNLRSVSKKPIRKNAKTLSSVNIERELSNSDCSLLVNNTNDLFSISSKTSSSQSNAKNDVDKVKKTIKIYVVLTCL